MIRDKEKTYQETTKCYDDKGNKSEEEMRVIKIILNKDKYITNYQQKI